MIDKNLFSAISEIEDFLNELYKLIPGIKEVTDILWQIKKQEIACEKEIAEDLIRLRAIKKTILYMREEKKKDEVKK